MTRTTKVLSVLLASVMMLSGCHDLLGLDVETEEECLDMGGYLTYYDFNYDGPGTYKWRCDF